MDEVSNLGENGIEASQPAAGMNINPAGDHLSSTSKNIIADAFSYTQVGVGNVIPSVIPGQSPVVTSLHSIPPDIDHVQQSVEKNLHDLQLFQPTKQSSVDTILCELNSSRELNSTRHVVGSSQPPACVDVPDVNSIQPATSYIQPPLDSGLSDINSLSPAMGPDQPPRNTVLHSIQPTMDLSQSPVETGALDVNLLQPSASTNQPTVNSHLHELSPVQNSMCSIQPRVYTVQRDVNSMQSSVSLDDSSKNTYLHEPNASSLQMPVGTVHPDMNSVSPEMAITQPSVEMDMHDMNSLQPSFGLAQQHVVVVSSDVNPVQHAAQSVDNGSPVVPRVLRTKRSFTTEFKLECVEHAERTKNKTQTARIFNVNRRRVQEWCTQKERLMSVPKQQKRLSGAGKRQISVIDTASKGGETDGRGGKANHEQKSLSSKNELDNETTKDLSLSMPATTIDPTLFDCIARNLSNIDHSMLSASMVKMLQEWSELTSQESKTTVEEPMEDVLQNRTDSSLPSQFFVMEVMNDNNLTEQPMEVGMESEGIPDSAAQHSIPAVQQEVVAAEYILGTNNGQNSVNIEGPVVNVGVADPNNPVGNTGTADVVNPVLNTASKEGETVGEISDPAEFNVSADNRQNSVNIKAGVNILDALMQVASVQLTPLEQMPGMETLPSEQQPVNLVLNGTGDSAKVEASSSATTASPLSTTISPLSTTIRTRVKKSYTVEFKLDCIAHAESTSKCAAARQFNVDRRRVQDWCSKKEKLQKLSGGQHMLREAKEQMDNDVEKQLAAWVKRQQEVGEHLTRKMVGDEATRIYQEKGDMEFVSSIGWVAKFMVRNNISLVSRTRLPLHLPPIEAVAHGTTSLS